MKKFLLLLLTLTLSLAAQAPYRHYAHVKTFYQELTPSALSIAKKYHLPPAAVLAISGLESGYDSGYVGQITGNILSLGAYKSDQELPSLYLPWCDTKKAVVYDPKVIKKCDPSALHYKQRPKSLKRDYRPEPYAGTLKNLAYFKYHPKEKAAAHYRCLEDFATRWIRATSKIKAFSKARVWLDALVKKEGIEVLYKKSTNIKFINTIGGVPHSFNYRETWPKKVEKIMSKVGLVPLTQAMALEGKSFEKAWNE